MVFSLEFDSENSCCILNFLDLRYHIKYPNLLLPDNLLIELDVDILHTQVTD